MPASKAARWLLAHLTERSRHFPGTMRVLHTSLQFILPVLPVPGQYLASACTSGHVMPEVLSSAKYLTVPHVNNTACVGTVLCVL